MQLHTKIRRKWGLAGAAVAALTMSLLPVSASFARGNDGYIKTNLVGDTPGVARVTDPQLVNPWGLAHSNTSPWWIADNGTGNSSVYLGWGLQARPAVTIPSPTSSSGGTPTGVVYQPKRPFDHEDFVISKNGQAAPSTFLFATEDGTIAGWNKDVDNNHAVIGLDRSMATDGKGNTGAVYKGLAFGAATTSEGNQEYIYATNFRFGTIEMTDENFKLFRWFTDPQLTKTCPMPGQCYAPFGIQNIGGNLYVTFALQDSHKHDDQSGAGNGFVDVFSTDGTLQRRLISNGNLNSPWGLAQAPNDFGQFSGKLLVGNFGDSTINAYDPATGMYAGTLSSEHHTPITIDGLWGLAFGNDMWAGRHNELFFTSGPSGESHGLFGKISTEDSFWH